MVISDDRVVEAIHQFINVTVVLWCQRLWCAFLLWHRRLDSKNSTFNRKIKFSTIIGICICVYLAQRLLPIMLPIKPPPPPIVKPITRDVIIYATFAYKNSTSFDITGHDTFVLLMLAHRSDNFPYMRCARLNNAAADTNPEVLAQLQSYDYHHLCELIMFIAVCNFPHHNNNNNVSIGATKHGTGASGGVRRNAKRRPRHNDDDEDGDENGDEVGGVMVDLGPQVLANDELRKAYAEMYPEFHELVVRTADRTPRNLLICVSRIFAFEKWHLLITAMEVYKALGVDLVVVHIVSAISAVFKLLKAYEADGQLAIRKGFKLPMLKAMNFDPELQVEYSGQLAMAHECFYEFRESAKFIALLDLDDLLVTTKFATLSDALNAAMLTYPMAPYFFVNKLESGILLEWHAKNGTKMTAKNFVYKFRDLIYTKQVYNSEKIVLRPHQIDAFWVHWAKDYKGMHKPVQLSNEYMTILHLAKDIDTKATRQYSKKLLINLSGLAVNESHFLLKSENEKLLSKMPKKYYYFDAIRHCAHFINNYPYSPVQVNTPCLSYKLCNFPKKKVACTIAKSKYYRKAILPTKIYRVHALQKSFFVNRKGGCFYRKLKF